MLSRLRIHGFKCFNSEELELKNLTLLTKNMRRTR